MPGRIYSRGIVMARVSLLQLSVAVTGRNYRKNAVTTSGAIYITSSAI
jgi:hypothetical protein